MKAFENVGGFLFDLDGVLFVGDSAIAGAVETIRLINERGIAHRYVTNTTSQSRQDLSDKLCAMGFAIAPQAILSAPAAACVYLRQRQPRACYFVVSEAIRDEFAEFAVSETAPDVVVIGDIGQAWSYELVNRLFQMVMAGADILALHKGKYWQTEQGLQVDIGAFIAGLEYATGVEATLMGKPSPAFFQAAVHELQCPKEEVVMIGDDIDSDVGGAQKAGIRGVLVRTGKYRQRYADASPIAPDAVLDSIAGLARFI